MSNVIAGLPHNNRYDALKLLLIEHYSLTRGEELRTLLSGLTIKGRKPTRLLAEMQSLARHGRFDEEDLKTLFLEYLPRDVRMTLQVVPGNVDALAADKIMEHRPTDSDQEVTAIQKSENDSIKEELAEITKQFKQMKARFEKSSRSRSRSRSNSRTRGSRSSSRSRSCESKICFYHRRFRDKAKKCTESCNWTQKKQDQPTSEN
ncbi:hypothetical protein ALC57_03906 [Trachymyrmex cornetzi]|uniref:Uncharacterized protein n=1 Tax=Trachymyrmex cornetzi TaxID=471704 RepID=A0A151JM81_9HYME|nr:hypothetical protein ALC57_03906 [Trachymyrmex cornetzi]